MMTIKDLDNLTLIEELEMSEDELSYINKQLRSAEDLVAIFRRRMAKEGDRFDVLLPEARRRKLVK